MDLNPVFRKIINPWYDSTPVCVAAIILLIPVFLFGIIGISVAGNDRDFTGHIWLPSLLTVLCGYVILSIMYRLIKRYFENLSNR